VSGVWLTNLADILRAAGVPVVEMKYTRGPYNGRTWQRVGFNGRGMTEFRGIMWHHDASPAGPSGTATIGPDGYGVNPTGALGWCMYMNVAPAAAAWVDMRGVWFLYASGLTNHAGLGASALAPNNTGNQFYYGIETDHTTNEPWPKAQLDSLRVGTAAIMRAYKLDPMRALEFHKTYAPGRKNDPDGLDLRSERELVTALVNENSANGKRISRLQRNLRTWRRKREAIREAGKTAGLATARNKIRELNQRIRKLGG
jgi:hypothetical protein